MTSKERLDNFVAGLPVDRRPNLTIVGTVVTKYTGIDIDTYCKDYKKMAEAAVALARDTGLDMIQIASDLLREAEGYGTEVIYHGDRLPDAGKWAVSSMAEAAELKPLKCRDIPRVYDLVLATKYAQELEKDIHTMTLIVGPFTVASNIVGVNEFIVSPAKNKAECAKLLDTVTETIIDVVDELAAVGAKYVYLADPVASLVSPKMYKKFILPVHERIYSHMAELGITGRLHMCGNTTATLPISSTCGAKIIDIDTQVDYQTAIDAVEGRVILNGNINPVADVFQATADHTYEAIMNLGKKFGKTQNLFMPGCELPTETPIENLKAMTKALEDIG